MEANSTGAVRATTLRSAEPSQTSRRPDVLVWMTVRSRLTSIGITGRLFPRSVRTSPRSPLRVLGVIPFPINSLAFIASDTEPEGYDVGEMVRLSIRRAILPRGG